MTTRSTWLAETVAAFALACLLDATAAAQGRTDVVTLVNGDRITGEIVRLDRGQLEFKTDDIGTLYLEWDKLVSLVTTRLVQVTTTDGRTFLGSLARSSDRAMAVVSQDAAAQLAMPDVTNITTIGRSFWRKLDGSFDVGFAYTRSSGIAQLNLKTDAVYRKPQSQMRLTVSFTQTAQRDEEGRDDRGAIDASYLRYPWRRWFIGAVSRFETNESLGLELRSQIGGAIGPRLVNSNRAQLTLGAGVSFNDERGVDVEPTQNLEALLLFNTSYYIYDRPRTNLDVMVQYYPSLSDMGRRRLQLDVSGKREVFKDLFVSVSVFYTVDTRPPNPDADTYDVGVLWSIGWTY
jgi:small nuclear ribonucleoprotein (snRNP)-like protein